MAPEISIVIPTYNRQERLRATLEALEQQTLDKALFEIIVVDDGSEDGTNEIVATMARNAHSEIRYILQKHNHAGTARNAGIFAARAPFILLMDNDIVVYPDHVGAHLDLHRKYPALEVAVLGRIISPIDKVDLLRRKDSFIPPINFMIGGEPVVGWEYLVTANVSLKKDFVVQAGLFTPGLPVTQDTELAWRLKERNLRLIYCPMAIAIHTEPLDTVDKVALFGKKYGRALAEWKGRIPLYQKEIWKLGGRFDGGWEHFRISPWGYLKDFVRRWAINKWTIRFLLHWAKRIPISNPPSSLLSRFCKEIWAYFYRNEYYERICRNRTHSSFFS